MKSLRSVPASRHAPALERAALLLILLLAFALRVYRLDAQAIWWDESLSVYRATRDLGTLLANTILIQNVITIDTLPQLYFVLLHLLIHAFGISEFALRFLSVFANVATIPLSYALARRWFTPSPSPLPHHTGEGLGVGVITALLGALSPFYVWYAQEARPYALVLFWSTLAVYALARAFDGDGCRLPQTNTDKRPLVRVPPRLSASNLWIGIYILASIAALYTHYFALFLFPFHAILILILVWQTPHRRWFFFLPAIPFASVIFLLPQITTSAASNVGTGPYLVPFDVMLRDLLNSFSVGITLDLTQAVWIDAAMVLLFAIGIIVPNSKSRFTFSPFRFGIIILAYLFIPILGVQILSLARPLYQNSRYLIAISPAFYLGVAAGVAALARWGRLLGLPALGVFVIGAVISLNNWYFDPRYGKDDHRAWAESLRERAHPDDFLILNSPHAEELYRYYADDILTMTTLPILRTDGKPSPDADRAAVRETLQKHARVWYLAMDVPFDDPDARIERFLNQEGVLLDQAKFAGTSTEITLALFVRALPVVEARGIQHLLDLAFDGHLRLRGYTAPTSVATGHRAVVTVYWQVDEPVGEDYATSLRLVNEGGTRVGQWEAIPLGNRSGSSTWQAQKIIADAHDVLIANGTPPGKYHWQVVPYHAATGTALGEVVTLGEILIVGN